MEIAIGSLTVLCIGLLIWVFLIHKKINRSKDKARNLKKDTQNIAFTAMDDESEEELNDKYLVDFRTDRFSYGGISISNNYVVDSSEPKEKKIKVDVKPIDVLRELTKPPTKWSLEGIEDKIAILREKEKFIKQVYAKKEVKGLIVCLENRKKYDTVTKNGKTFREYFSQFDTTDENNIDKITEKYSLKMDSADIFIPEFPDDAIKIMKEYKEKIEELCDKEPRYYVIAQEKDFEKQENKRDPILLSQSPFGFYYYILGAWDTEMLYLPEL